MTLLLDRRPDSLKQEAAPKVRRSFQDAVQSVLEGSRLKAILDGKEDATTWHEAVNADIAAAKQLVSDLAEDLTAITGQPVTVGGAYSPHKLTTAITQAYDSLMHRVTALHKAWAEGVEAIESRALKVITGNKLKGRSREERVGNNVYTVNEKTFFPMTEVFTDRDTATVQFSRPTPDGGEKLYKMTLAGYAFVSPDDYTLRVPKSVEQKLAVLRITHFNYHPKILTGVLVDKQVVETTERLWVRQYDNDPALVIHLGLKHAAFAVDYWEDNPTEEEKAPFLNHALLGLFLMALLFQSLHVFTWAYSTWETWTCVGASIGAAVALIAGVIGLVNYSDQLADRRKYRANHLLGKHGISI